MYKKKLLFVLHSFGKNGIGGITNSLKNLLIYLAKEEAYDIQLLVFNSETVPIELPETITMLKAPYLLKTYFTPIRSLHGIDVWVHIIQMLIGKVCTKKYASIFARYCKKNQNIYDLAISYENNFPAENFYSLTNEYVVRNVCAAVKTAYVHNDPYRLGFTSTYVMKQYKNFDYVACVSDTCRKKVIDICPQIANKTVTTYNFIGDYDIKRSNERKEDDVFSIISVCRLFNNQKRIDRMIDVAAVLKEKKCKFCWHIYGDGPDLEAMQEYSVKSKVDDCIKFMGITTDSISVISKYDIFAMMSDYEAYPMTIIEALSAVTPVICTDIDEAYEVLCDNVNSIIVEKDVTVIANEIEKLIADRERLGRMREYIAQNPVSNHVSYKQFCSMLQ